MAAVALQARSLAGIAGLRHGFFTRMGGISAGIYAGLNCGYGSGDDRAVVRENRQRAAVALGRHEPDIVTVHQVHSGDAVTVETPWRWHEAPRADAMATRIPGAMLGIMTADCAPVLFADPVAGVVGAAHAGWRGAKAGVVEATVCRLEALGARRDALRAVIGPAIGPQSYEVDGGFRDGFLADDPANEAHFRAGARDGRFLFDLPGYLVARLDRLGLSSVERLGHDTYAEEERFFSYRRATHRNEPDYGRQLSAIALD